MLPSIVEYLLSLPRPGGGWLVHRGGLQVIIPAFPPNTTITYIVTPLADAYAQLGWATRFGTTMVPNAFTGFVQQWGSRLYTGTLSQRIISDVVDYFIVVTLAEPTYLYISNASPLNQYCEVIGDFLVISSEEDYALILDALSRVYTSAKSEQLAQEANKLLTRLAVQIPAPRVIP